MRIPDHGKSRDQVMDALQAMRRDDADKTEGRTFGLTFLASDEATRLVEEANRSFLWENGLDPTVYPSLLRLEQDVVAMAAAHLGGDEHVVGNFTSGGTESILLAVKTARDRARALNPEITRPEMVLPVTAHAAFHKAAHYFCVEPVVVDVDPETFQPGIEDYRRVVGDNTVLLVGSAPSYAHGVMDPIAELGELAQEKDLLLHVDGCIGAFMLPLFRELGTEVPPFDFSVPGVTSISMDFHKYGFAAKGSSVILHKNAQLRQHQIFTCSQWTGYSVINPTVQSTKSGGPLASTWAVLNYLGHDGYMELARTLRETTKELIDAVNAVDGVEVLGDPIMSLFAFGATADDLNLFDLCDRMAAKGWHMQPQLRLGDVRESVHLTVMPNNAGKAGAFGADLAACVKDVRENPAPSPLAGLAEQLTPEALAGGLDVNAMIGSVMGGGDLPTEMAAVNDLLNKLPTSVQNALMTAFFNQVSGVPAARD